MPQGEAGIMVADPVLIVVPTYHEFENLAELTERIWEAEPKGHILLVDDGSNDGTVEWVGGHRNFNQSLFLIERQTKLGLGSAYRTGFQWALERGYGTVVQMDADLSHDPAMIRHFLKEIRAGADLVLGSRYMGGVRVLNWPISRLLLSVFAGAYVRGLTGMPFTDPTGGFKCFRADLLKTLEIGRMKSNGYAFQIETTHAAWMRRAHIVEVPIVFEERRSGSSKMSRGIAAEAVWQVIRLAPQRRPPL
jgi:dolichol-phosphate mannosyltransferase